MTDERWGFSRGVKTLLNCSVLKVFENLSSCLSGISSLPPNLKGRFLHLMSKRGCIEDSNISQVLHRRVNKIDLSESDISDVCLQHIASACPQLVKIDLNSNKIPRTSVASQGLCSLAQNCRHLQVVYLRRCINVTDEAVIALSSSCPQLRELNIGSCQQITDAALRGLGQNSAFLKSIDFSNTQVTDEGVFYLVTGEASDSLTEIHMSRCTALTDEAVEAVIQSCPKIAIFIFHGCVNITDRSREALEEILGPTSRMKQVTWTVY